MNDSRTLECPLTHLRLRRHRQELPVWGSSDTPDVPKRSWVPQQEIGAEAEECGGVEPGGG